MIHFAELDEAAVPYLLAISQNKFEAILTQVEAKWDIISMLCLLVFCLAFAAAIYAIFRPYSMPRKVLTFLFALGVGYVLSYVTVHYALRAEFYKMACHELWQDAGDSPEVSQKKCALRNDVKLSRLPKK